ncbi:MAG: hypothetical protein PHY31_09050, partial [Smithellaceae bacterium]|nr:hypothetical protein [Smithellaceae bacterium]
PNLNYYYSGREAYPDAILGLNKQYTLDSDFWVPIKTDAFRGLVAGMKKKASEDRAVIHGYVVRDDKAQPIGVWYARLGITTVIHMKPNNLVSIYTPGESVGPTEGAGGSAGSAGGGGGEGGGGDD